MAERCHCIINPDNGAVEGILDMSGFRKTKKNQTTEVLNGIVSQKNQNHFCYGKTGIKCLK
jgi:glutamine cyclotransferase